jgi:hypothetical protein
MALVNFTQASLDFLNDVRNKWRWVEDMCTRVEKMRGPNVANGPGGITISAPKIPAAKPAAQGGGGSGGGIVTPVSVTKDGGSLGVDGVSACNATYTVKSADGSITYGATKQVTKPDGSTASKALFRGLKVALQSGTYGFAILNSDNTVKALLVVLDEVPVTESDCT